MAARKLTPETIVPEDLYVERQADRDLGRIVEEMGRPGYVLVARQMGKTNLLIHMKGRRENCGDIVIYFDLSNRFDSLRDLFRWIIDGILEHEDISVRSVADDIYAARSTSDIAPHLEYDRHLRTILRAIGDKRVVIILDEVDSLSSSAFSDAFWAQVRSMYFARANHQEYRRLTYALSGVAEPSDLIKDKTISPFNIGEKIYLNDFTKDELQTFSVRAGLELSADALGAIYDWTGGNPRMSWDLCSALEAVKERGEAIDRRVIDAAVDQLYLKAFDRAPVDHIRDLAQSDQALRDAVVTIRYGKGDTLDPRIRSKLYLAGITRAAELSPVLKNKVIDLALSSDWLDQVSRDQASLAERAVAAYQDKRYSDAIALLETWRQQEGDAAIVGEYRVVLGAAHYSLGRGSLAATELRAALPTLDSLATAQWAKYMLALSLISIGDFPASLPLLEELAEAKGDYRNPARQALAGALAATFPEENKSKILELSGALIDDLKVDLEADQRSDLIAASYYNIAQALIATSDRTGAIENLILAEEYAPEDFLPEVMLARLRLLSEQGDRRRLAEAVAGMIITSTLQLPAEEGISSRFNYKVLSNAILRLIQTNPFGEDAKELISGLLKKLLPDRTPFEGLLEIFRRSSENERRALLPLLTFAVREFSHAVVRDADKIEAYRSIARYAAPNELPSALRAYLDQFKELMREDLLNEEDIVLFVDYATTLNQQGKFSEAADMLSLLDPYWGKIYASGRLISIAMRSMQLTALQGKRDVNGAKAAAAEVVRIGALPAAQEEGQTAELVSTMRHLVDQARRYIDAHTPDPYRHFGRNERVIVRRRATGDEVTLKFKHAETELRSGNFELVRRIK